MSRTKETKSVLVLAQDVIRECRTGDTRRSRLLERLIFENGWLLSQLSIELKELYAFVRHQACEEAYRTMESCRQGVHVPPGVMLLIRDCESLAIEPEEFGATPFAVMTYASYEAEELVRTCRSGNAVRLDTCTSHIEFFLEDHRYCDHITATTLRLTERDHLFLKIGSFTRALLALQSLRSAPSSALVDVIRAELDRYHHTQADLGATDQEWSILK